MSDHDQRNGVLRTPDGKWIGSGNPPGFESITGKVRAMLNKYHRSVENLEKVFDRLRELACDDQVISATDKNGNEHTYAKRPDPAFMKLYLERLLGPPKDQDEDIDLSDAPPEVLTYIREKFKTN